MTTYYQREARERAREMGGMLKLATTQYHNPNRDEPRNLTTNQKIALPVYIQRIIDGAPDFYHPETIVFWEELGLKARIVITNVLHQYMVAHQRAPHQWSSFEKLVQKLVELENNGEK